MANIFKKKIYTKIPENAELIERDGKQFARIRGRDGKLQTFPVLVNGKGELCFVRKAKYFRAKFRDANDRIVEKSTRCTDKQAALSVLGNWLKNEEKIRAKLLSREDLEIGKYQSVTMSCHVEEYAAYLRQRKTAEKRVKFTISYINECLSGCGWRLLQDLNSDELTGYVEQKTDRSGNPSSPAVKNSRIEAMMAFGNWLAGKRISGKRAHWKGQKRLAENPFAGMAKFDKRHDVRRRRRALTAEELGRLLRVTAERPLREAMTVRHGPSKGKQKANLRPKTIERLQRLGKERQLIYKTLVMTGLRKSELASITVAQSFLDVESPYLQLRAEDEKNRQGNQIPLRADLAAELLQWVRQTKREKGDYLLSVPAGLVKILNRDLEVAGIPKVDDRGYTIDVHAFRHTFGTMLSQAGITPRVAMKAMRHSRLELTMNVYTDPRLLDVKSAVEQLPEI